MTLQYNDILSRANEVYRNLKHYEWNGYTAPELQPQIHSDQVKAVLSILVGDINAELSTLKRRIVSLERELDADL